MPLIIFIIRHTQIEIKALMSLNILLDHPAGIGDHSTEDLYSNLEEALSALADAEDRLETLEEYFNRG